MDINNEEESNNIAKYLDGLKFKSNYWIGYNDLVKENDFRWSDGSMAKFTNWYKNPSNDHTEPNNAGGKEDCTAVYRNYNNTWNDYNCASWQLLFMCEKSKGKPWCALCIYSNSRTWRCHFHKPFCLLNFAKL